MIAVAGLSDKTKAALLNAWIGRDLLPLRDSPLCTLRIHHCNIDHIVIAEPPMHDSRYRSSITFAELYQASRKFLPPISILLLTPSQITSGTRPYAARIVPWMSC